jgi:hypothetical protein
MMLTGPTPSRQGLLHAADCPVPLDRTAKQVWRGREHVPCAMHRLGQRAVWVLLNFVRNSCLCWMAVARERQEAQKALYASMLG